MGYPTAGRRTQRNKLLQQQQQQQEQQQQQRQYQQQRQQQHQQQRQQQQRQQQQHQKQQRQQQRSPQQQRPPVHQRIGEAEASNEERRPQQQGQRRPRNQKQRNHQPSNRAAPQGGDGPHQPEEQLPRLQDLLSELDEATEETARSFIRQCRSTYQDIQLISGGVQHLFTKPEASIQRIISNLQIRDQMEVERLFFNDLVQMQFKEMRRLSLEQAQARLSASRQGGREEAIKLHEATKDHTTMYIAKIMAREAQKDFDSFLAVFKLKPEDITPAPPTPRTEHPTYNFNEKLAALLQRHSNVIHATPPGHPTQKANPNPTARSSPANKGSDAQTSEVAQQPTTRTIQDESLDYALELSYSDAIRLGTSPRAGDTHTMNASPGAGTQAIAAARAAHSQETRTRSQVRGQFILETGTEFTCRICNREFPNRKACTTHLNTHGEEIYGPHGEALNS